MKKSFQKEAFREELLLWFEQEKEDYPWRRTKDPWAILVSEVMLQQTQVATVLGKGFYVSFLKKFPTVQAIATASENDILRAWEGLGYYRRVRNLQKTAQAVVEEYQGVFPTSHQDLLNLPGVGPYTAGAVSAFAYDQAQALVDANVTRVFSRLFNYLEEVDSGKGIKQMWTWAENLLEVNQPAAYNSALMELGQKICKNKKPQCMLCPVRSHCSARNPEDLPIKKPKRKTVEVDERCVWVVKNGKVLLEQQDVSQRREGMWSLPKREDIESSDHLLKMKYAITHYKVTLYVVEVKGVRAKKNEKWVDLTKLESVPMPSPFRKAIEQLKTLHKGE